MDNSSRIHPNDNSIDDKNKNKRAGLFGTITKAFGHLIGVVTGKKIEVDIVWNEPKDIYTGTSLTSLQLNAIVKTNNDRNNQYLNELTDSSLLYTPGPGSILDEGNHQLEVVFDVGSSDISKKFIKLTKKVVNITILPRVIPTIIWSDKIMRHNDSITNIILDAKCVDTNGTFTYNMTLGTKLIMNSNGYHEVTLKFEPIDNVKYSRIFKTIKITMIKALPTIKWNPMPMYAGQRVTQDQLNAEVIEDELVDGCELEYYPSIGHVFTIENNDDNFLYDFDDNNDDEEILYNLILSNIYANNLLDAGTRFDGQDPGLIINIGDHYTFTTERVQDGGTSTGFPEVYKDICISLADINKGLVIEVSAHNMDKNNKSKKLIGTGMINVKDAIPKNDIKCSFTIPLKDQGEVTMIGKLSLLNDKDIDESVSLLIQNICVNNLQNVGTMVDRQDPGVNLKIGKLYNFTTDRASDAGTDANFREVFKDISLKTSDIESGLLMEVEVHNMDKNLKSKKLIGKGNMFVSDIKKRDEMVVISIPLTPKGTLTMEGIINTKTIDEDEEDKREGPVRIRIDQLAISDVENAGSMFDKQDPGLILHIGHYYLKTDRIQEGGTDVCFLEIFDNIEVDYEDILEIEVHNIDGNGLSKKKIGSGIVVLSDVVKKQLKLIDIKIPLINSKGSVQGTVTMRCFLEKLVSDIIAEPISQNSRIKLTIDQLSIKNVEDAGSFVDKQDPAVVVYIGSNKLCTERIIEGGVTTAFSEVFDGIIAKYKDSVVVEVHNMSNCISKKKIGKGKFKISQMLPMAGIAKGITLHLTNSKNKTQGLLCMRMKLEVLPDSSTGAITLNYKPPVRLQAFYDVYTMTAYIKILPKLDYKLTWEPRPFTYVNAKLDNEFYFNAVADISGYSTYYYYDPNKNVGDEWVLLTDETFLPIGIHNICVTFTPEKSIYMIEYAYQVLYVRPKSIPFIEWESPIYMDYGALTEKELSAKCIVPGTFELSKSIGDIMNVSLAGHVVRTRFTPFDLEQFTIEEKEVLIIVPIIPSILWTIQNCNSSLHNNDNILYDGQSLSEDELCISILDQDLVGYGTVVYEPRLGETLPVGNQILKATYIADDKFNNIYQKRTSVTIEVTILKKVDPIINWANPAPIRCGQKLKKSELNATCNEVSGDFSYYPPLDKVLPLSLTGTILKCVFHPHNKVKYNAVTKEVTLIVLKSLAKIYWQYPKFLYEGQPITEKQLNARILNEELTDGLLIFTPCVGTILSAGVHDLNVTFIPSSRNQDSYNTTEVKVSITIKPQKVPDVLWTTPSAIYENMSLTSEHLNATCQRNRGNFTYKPDVDTIMSVPGTVILTVRFDPENSIEYCSVEKSVELEVKARILPRLTWSNPNAIFYGFLLNESILNATCDYDDGIITYDPPLGTKLNVTNDETGAHILRATYIPNDKSRYHETQTTVTISVKKTTPRVKWPHQGKVFENTPLPESLLCAKIIDDELNVEGGTFIYNPNAGEILGLGEHMLMVVYEPPSDLLDRFTVASAFTKVKVIPHKVSVDNKVPKILPGWEIGKDKRITMNRPPEPKDFAWTAWGTRDPEKR